MSLIEIPQPADRNWKYRFFEILPGVISWSILILPWGLSQISPRLTAYFVIGYLLLWFSKAVGLNIRAVQGHQTMKDHQSMNWRALNDDLEHLIIKTAKPPKWHSPVIERLKRWPTDKRRILPSEVYHAVVLANYNETRDILEPTIQAIIDSEYDKAKIILFLAYEERGGAAIESQAKQLEADFKDKFLHMEIVRHPKDIPGELIGKGGNITYAGRRLEKYLKAQAIDPSKVLVTTLDSDNRPDKKYFGALTYTFCATENPKHVSYQPIPMFLNNIWDAPAPMRVIATGNSFWMVVQSLRPHMLRNFSAHAQPMDALIETDFWSVRTIVEDGHQFWRSYFAFEGDYEVYPIYVPIYQDAVLAATYRKTLKAQFIQIRRWAWGASDIAYVAYAGFMQTSRVPRRKLISKMLRLTEGHISWATAPLILALAGFIPLWLHPQSFISNQLPVIASRIQTIAMVGLLITLFLSLSTLPPKPERYRRHRSLFMIIQWVYLPVTSIVYSSFAALNSQTRLMFGRYLGKFDVTEKAVVGKRPSDLAGRSFIKRLLHLK